MANQIQKTNSSSALFQAIFTFVIPIIILTKFSSESQLGPVKGFLLALSFPVIYEIYSIQKRKKLSILSVVAIIGILATGAVSLLGLSEDWLAIRRSVPYLFMGIALLISIIIKHPFVDIMLKQILDMDSIKAAATKKHTLQELQRKIALSGYILCAVLFIIAIVSYVLTKVVILSPTDTSAFNEEYARLRIISLPIITLPLLLSLSGIVIYLIQSLEKLTGLKAEELIKKR